MSLMHVLAVLYLKFVHFWSNFIFQEKRREEEEAEAQLAIQLAQEAAHAKMAKDLSEEVFKHV